MRAHRWAAAAATTTAALALSSCGIAPSAAPPAPPSGPPLPASLAGLPLGSPKEQAGSIAGAQEDGPTGTDPCGLQDPAAAAAVTGQPLQAGPAGPLQPYGNANECQITTGDELGDGPTPAWTFTTTAGAPFSPAMQRSAAPAQLGGLQLWRVDMGGRYSSTCQFYQPTAPGVANRVSVRSEGASTEPAPPGASCRMAAHYLAQLGPRWQHPPKRADHAPGLPQLKLAEVMSPCDPLRVALTQLPPPADALPGRSRVEHAQHGQPDPATCSLDDELPTHTGNRHYDTTYGERHTRTDVQFQAKTPDKRPEKTVAGMPASEITASNGCSLWVQLGAPIGAKIAVAPHAEIHADTCENAEKVAGITVGMAHDKGAV